MLRAYRLQPWLPASRSVRSASTQRRHGVAQHRRWLASSSPSPPPAPRDGESKGKAGEGGLASFARSSGIMFGRGLATLKQRADRSGAVDEAVGPRSAHGKQCFQENSLTSYL